MPKLINKNPKLRKLGKYAVVRQDGKTIYLKNTQNGNAKHGTPEALAAYNRFCTELQNNPIACLAKESRSITLTELAVAYLDYAKAMFNKSDYYNIRTIVSDYNARCIKLGKTAVDFPLFYDILRKAEPTVGILRYAKYNIPRQLCGR